jgi:hypothetical protein
VEDALRFGNGSYRLMSTALRDYAYRTLIDSVRLEQRIRTRNSRKECRPKVHSHARPDPYTPTQARNLAASCAPHSSARYSKGSES